MTSIETRPETARGRAMYEMLLAVHAVIRRNLELIQELAAQALDGADPEELRRQLHTLKRDGMLWRLQVNCLRYCSFVHSHHNAEDADFFVELRETNPAISPGIDRLQADHRRVSDDLDAVEDARQPPRRGRRPTGPRGGRRNASGSPREPTRPPRIRRAGHRGDRTTRPRAAVTSLQGPERGRGGDAPDSRFKRDGAAHRCLKVAV